MAVLPRRPRLQALAWLAVVLLLAATSVCLCRDVPAAGALPGMRALLQSTTTPSPDSPPAPPPPPPFPRPICRRCPPRCPPEGCSGNGSP
ncbi:unnamed protein product [Miscanthus lutarioriparius]|uniref:Uncharacterized protein n=1 Tax=Miscanthus lutarioriparius TaxID=422564 RepID=A0A811PZT5_9POAL|nr:unnamed protein product [Miscanthus lutarioriparius]